MNDKDQFMSSLQLEDAFSSWFTFVSLHTWFCLYRLASEGEDGVAVGNAMIKSMWLDVEHRTKSTMIGADIPHALRKRQLKYLVGQYRSRLIAFDEGLLSNNDRLMAGAVWRNVYGLNCPDLRLLEQAVAYLRKNVAFIESQSSETLLTTGIVRFLPLNSDVEDRERSRRIIEQIAILKEDLKKLKLD